MARMAMVAKTFAFGFAALALSASGCLEDPSGRGWHPIAVHRPMSVSVRSRADADWVKVRIMALPRVYPTSPASARAGKPCERPCPLRRAC